MFSSWPIFLLLPVIALGANCPVCPANGIWSDWTETAPCPSTCGGCNETTYTRTCLSDEMGCKCNGDPQKSMTCGTQACNWPRVNATAPNCCKGTPTTIKNWVHCAPLPDNYTLPCCPDNGYWTPWTDFAKVANQAAWQRTRKCVSGGYNCPCKGDSVYTTTICPCIPIVVITNTTNTCTASGAHDNPWSVRKPIFLSSQCKTQLVLEASNFRNDFFTNSLDGASVFGTIGWIDDTNKCQQATITYNGSPKMLGSNGQFNKYYLECDLKKLKFSGSVEGIQMTYVTAFAQYY